MVRPAPRLPVLAAALAAGLGLAGAPDPVSAGGAEPAGPAAEGPDMPEDAAAVTLTVPVDRDRRALPLIVLELGTLPSGAAVTVARADGTVLGGYAPFGPDRGPSTTRIPLPGGWPDGPLTLRVWVEEDDGTRRAPSDRELRSLRLDELR